MTAEHEAVFRRALALPETERALLVETLLESLDPEPDEVTDAEFYAELERRRAEVELDPSSIISWNDLLMEE